MGIEVSATARCDLARVWEAWTSPDDIKAWNAASDDWHTTHAEVDLRVGGGFVARMEAKDGSFGFDFKGTYTRIVDNELIEYFLEDGRRVRVEFTPLEAGVRITETFDPEEQNPEDLQRQGWQAILDNFVRHVESRS